MKKKFTVQNNSEGVQSNITSQESSVNCFGDFFKKVFKKESLEKEIDYQVNLESYKMNNPFDSVSKKNVTNSSNQLGIKPIASSTSNATGSGRNKVGLKPGHSLMDWIRLTNSNTDLTCGYQGTLKVTGEELSKHNKIDDAWTSIQGNVFNITPYFNFHPGGSDELFRAAGKESTLLFKQIHAWVNWSSILQRCKVGHLINDSDVQIAEVDEPQEINKTSNDTNEKKTVTVHSNIKFELIEETDSIYEFETNKTFQLQNLYINLSPDTEINNKPRSAYWVDSPNNFDLVIVFEKPIEKQDYMIDLTEDKVLKIKIYFGVLICCSLKFYLPSKLDKKKIIHKMMDNNNSLKICLYKLKEELWAGQLNSDKIEYELSTHNRSNTYYRMMKLLKKKPVTHDTYLFTFEVPEGLYLPVKFGNHFGLKLNSQNEELFRFYTCIPYCFTQNNLIIDDKSLEDFEVQKTISFIIKVYEDGQFTSKLDQIKVNKSVNLSDLFLIDFDLKEILQTKKNIYLIAAGTGITPMLSVIYMISMLLRKKKLENNLDEKSFKNLSLLFFNKTEKDIIINECLEKIIKLKLEGFKFEFNSILSRPSEKWKGLKGRISEDLIKKFIKKIDEEDFILMCGPDPFNFSALSIFDSLFKLQQSSYKVFSS